MSRILAIDPGPEYSAFIVWDGKEISVKSIEENNSALVALKDYYLPNAQCVIEMVASYGMSVGKEVFETCVWIGRFMQAWGGGVTLLYRRDVKMHLCHSMKAKDSNIRQALIDRFGPPGTKKAPGLTYGLKADMWQAFALAVTWRYIHYGK